MSRADEAQLKLVSEEKKRVQDELVLLAKEALPEANEDKSGVLTVTVVESRNVGAEAAESETGVDVVSDDEQSGKGVRYVVSVEPESVLSPAEEAESEVQFTELPGSARFALSNLEATITIRFGLSLEHAVVLPLNNQKKDMDFEHLSTWHTVSAGEETETPQVTDVSDVPQLKLRVSYERTNREEVARLNATIRALQQQHSELAKQEASLRGPPKVTPVSKGGRIPLVDDGDLDDEYPTGNMVTRAVRSVTSAVTGSVKGVVTGVLRYRAFVMFVGGAVFFHLHGDDMAV